MAVGEKRERLTIDVTPEIHRKIKSYAASRGKSLREFVLESIKTQMERDSEVEDLRAMTIKPTTILKDLWDNDSDSAYDEI
ncbi:MAG TPA: hypothetical protein PLP29_08140 [Candidatus Ozemobacteraceae bacterium]|nr:hypothetical protein [Candidatus Ozemobacteraceae bacterium]